MEKTVEMFIIRIDATKNVFYLKIFILEYLTCVAQNVRAYGY